MKIRIMCLCFAALLSLCFGAHAQAHISIAELHDQAEAMGRWTKTYDTPNGPLEVDIPIIVPDADAAPVITVERAAALTKTQYDAIVTGSLERESFLLDQPNENGDSVPTEFFIGRDDKNNVPPAFGEVKTLWIQLDDYMFRKSGGIAAAAPDTYHYPWELDMNAPLVRGSTQTLDELMAVWQHHIDTYYPDQEVTIRPKRIILHGSLLSDEAASARAANINGYYEVWAEQYLNGFPLFGPLISQEGANAYRVSYASSGHTNVIARKLEPYGVGVSTVHTHLMLLGDRNDSMRTITDIIALRSTEITDIPLVPLDQVIAGIEAEIEKGHLTALYSLRLGYILYSNPDMTDHAWAVPTWVLDCNYVTDSSRKAAENFHKHYPELQRWEMYEFVQLPIDAQTGTPMIITTGDEETFRVPSVLTWDNAQ